MGEVKEHFCRGISCFARVSSCFWIVSLCGALNLYFIDIRLVSYLFIFVQILLSVLACWDLTFEQDEFLFLTFFYLRNQFSSKIMLELVILDSCEILLIGYRFEFIFI